MNYLIVITVIMTFVIAITIIITPLVAINCNLHSPLLLCMSATYNRGILSACSNWHRSQSTAQAKGQDGHGEHGGSDHAQNTCMCQHLHSCYNQDRLSRRKYDEMAAAQPRTSNF